jgi:hypothetical protein
VMFLLRLPYVVSAAALASSASWPKSSLDQHSQSTSGEWPTNAPEEAAMAQAGRWYWSTAACSRMFCGRPVGLTIWADGGAFDM